MNLNLKGNNYSSLPPDTPSMHRGSAVDGGTARGEIQIVLDRKEISAQQQVRPAQEMPDVQAVQKRPLAEEIEVAMPPVQRTTPPERLAALNFESAAKIYAPRNQLRELGREVCDHKLRWTLYLLGSALYGTTGGLVSGTGISRYMYPHPSGDEYGKQLDVVLRGGVIGGLAGPPLLVLGVVGQTTVSTLKSLWSLNGPKTRIQDGLRYLAGNPGCNLNFMKMFARLPRAWGAEGDAAFYRRLSSAVDMMVKHPALAEKVFKLAQTMGSEYMTNDAVREFDKRAHSEILEFKMRELPEGNERTEMTKYLYCCNVAIPAITEDMDTDWNPSEQIFEELRKRGVIHFDGPAVADHGPLDSDALKNACTEVRNRLNAFMDPADTTTGLAYKSKLAESDAERNAREARVEAVLEMAKDWRSVAVSNIHCRNRAVGEPPDDPNTRRALELYVWDGVPKQIAERVSVRILEQRVMGPENEEPGPSDTEIAAAAFNEIMAGCGIRTWVDEDKNFSVNDSANLDPGDTGRHDKPWAQVGGLATKNWHESPLLRSYLKVIEARRHAHEG